jgi:hypothetical protein
MYYVRYIKVEYWALTRMDHGPWNIMDNQLASLTHFTTRVFSEPNELDEN